MWLYEYCLQFMPYKKWNQQELIFNSHGTSWQLTAEIVLNADNGGNECDRSKIAQGRIFEIQGRIFWCNTIFPKFFSVDISPEMNRKLTGNDIL